MELTSDRMLSFPTLSPETGVNGLMDLYTSTIDFVSSPNGSNGTEQNVEFYREAQIGFLVAIFLMIVVGNSIVLLAIALSRERHVSRMNYFIMNLALADLLNGLLSVLVDLIVKITINWYADNHACKFIMFTRGVVTYASTYMIVALSLDRLTAVARPMQFGVSRTRAKILVGTAWLLSLIFSLPMAFLFQKVEPPPGHSGPLCFIDLGESRNWQIYLTLIAAALFFIPAAIISLCYVIIIVIIAKSSPLLEPVKNEKPKRQIKNRVVHSRNLPTPRNDSRTSSRGIIPQAKIRTIKMTFVVVLVFIICWSPYFIFNIFSTYGYIPNTSTWQKIDILVQSLGQLNSAVNPVIYGVFNSRICRFFRPRRFPSKIPDQWCSCCVSETPSRVVPKDYSPVTETEQQTAFNGGGSRAICQNSASRELLHGCSRKRPDNLSLTILARNSTHSCDVNNDCLADTLTTELNFGDFNGGTSVIK